MSHARSIILAHFEDQLDAMGKALKANDSDTVLKYAQALQPLVRELRISSHNSPKWPDDSRNAVDGQVIRIRARVLAYLEQMARSQATAHRELQILLPSRSKGPGYSAQGWGTNPSLR